MISLKIIGNFIDNFTIRANADRFNIIGGQHLCITLNKL